jgi:hypothetical protein
VSLLAPTKELVDFLNADAQLSVAAPRQFWKDNAPQSPLGAEEVAGVVSLQTPVSTHTGGGARHLECWYAVQVVGPSALIARIRTGARRIDDLLHNGPVALSGYQVLGAFLEEPIERSEQEPGAGGIRWEWLGGLYRLFVAATS